MQTYRQAIIDINFFGMGPSVFVDASFHYNGGAAAKHGLTQTALM